MKKMDIEKSSLQRELGDKELFDREGNGRTNENTYS